MELFELIYKHSLLNPERVAFVDDTQKVTYRHLWEKIQANRRYLIEKGFQNQVVVYKVDSQLKFAVDFLCLAAAGCWIIPITRDVSVGTYKKLMFDHGITLEIDSNGLLGDWLCQKDEQFSLDEEHCGIYHLTSGSTGEPKICVRSLRALRYEGIAYRKSLSLQAAKIVSLSPIYHSFAFGAAYITSLISGSSVYLMDKFIPRKAVDVIGMWKANVVIAVPIMIKAITTVSLLKQYNFSDLSIVLVGTGIVPTEIRTAFKERFGVFLSSNYGSTETGGLIIRLTENPAESIGREMDGVEIKLVCKESSLDMDKEEGEIYVRSKCMMSRYLNNEKNVFDEDGFFPMGDILKKDNQGFYYVKGRIKNLINIGGKKVNPKEVEEVLLRFPGIKDCIVCREMRTDSQEIVKAIIVGDNLDKTKLREYLRHELADYKIPSLIEEVKNIHRNEMGKIVN